MCFVSVPYLVCNVYCSKDIFYPLTSLDIVCHEIGHSVTQWHGGNMEYQRQPGAMNEAYSDIIGMYFNT